MKLFYIPEYIYYYLNSKYPLKKKSENYIYDEIFHIYSFYKYKIFNPKTLEGITEIIFISPINSLYLDLIRKIIILNKDILKNIELKIFLSNDIEINFKEIIGSEINTTETLKLDNYELLRNELKNLSYLHSFFNKFKLEHLIILGEIQKFKNNKNIDKQNINLQFKNLGNFLEIDQIGKYKFNFSLKKNTEFSFIFNNLISKIPFDNLINGFKTLIYRGDIIFNKEGEILYYQNILKFNHLISYVEEILNTNNFFIISKIKEDFLKLYTPFSICPICSNGNLYELKKEFICNNCNFKKNKKIDNLDLILKKKDLINILNLGYVEKTKNRQKYKINLTDNIILLGEKKIDYILEFKNSTKKLSKKSDSISNIKEAFTIEEAKNIIIKFGKPEIIYFSNKHNYEFADYVINFLDNLKIENKNFKYKIIEKDKILKKELDEFLKLNLNILKRT